MFRASHHSARLEIELARRNIPFVKYGGLKFIEAAHVKDLLAILRWAENPRDTIAAFRALQLLPGIGPATARKATTYLAGHGFDLSELAGFAPPAAAAVIGSGLDPSAGGRRAARCGAACKDLDNDHAAAAARAWRAMIGHGVADPVDVAKNIAKSDSFPALVDRVAKDIWETRRRDRLSDPALIATVAAKVHDKYGSELLNTADVDKQALIIAHELAKEPGFAALVAAARGQ